MEKKISFILFIIIALTACKPDVVKQKKVEPLKGKNIATMSKGAMDDECIRYVDAYRKWINDYVRAVNVYASDTSKLQSIKEYARLINDGRRLEMPTNCQTEKAFQDTILHITNQAKLLIKDSHGAGIDELLNP